MSETEPAAGHKAIIPALPIQVIPFAADMIDTAPAKGSLSKAMQAMLDLAKALSAATDVDEIAAAIAAKAPAVLGADRVQLNPDDPASLLEIVNAREPALADIVADHAAAAIARARATAHSIDEANIAAGLKYASEIQMRMLPSATVTLAENTPFEMHAHIRPAKMVGGDLYDFAITGDRLYFCIGDVSGKGIGSALVMALTKTLFRANVAYYDDAARLTEAVNVRLCEETGPTMFVTAFCGFLDFTDGTLRFCNAGHERPFLLRSNGTVDLLESRPGIALGVMPKFSYGLQETTLAPGDALFLYTDGVTEATNAGEELFTIQRLRETLERSAGESAVRVLEATIDEVDRFVEHAPQADDIAMMCIRYRGRAQAGMPEDEAA